MYLSFKDLDTEIYENINKIETIIKILSEKLNIDDNLLDQFDFTNENYNEVLENIKNDIFKYFQTIKKFVQDEYKIFIDEKLLFLTIIYIIQKNQSLFEEYFNNKFNFDLHEIIKNIKLFNIFIFILYLESLVEEKITKNNFEKSILSIQFLDEKNLIFLLQIIKFLF